MFLRFRKTWSVIFIILLFTLLLIITETYLQQEVSKDNDFRKYISQDIEECLRTQAFCIPGRIFFSDETGCGCELTEEEKSKRINCENYQRNVEACIEIYQPVCGWNDPEKVQCREGSCLETFSNPCFACLNEDILYYTEGECSSN